MVFGLSIEGRAEGNHNFDISKNLEIFNDIYKQLDAYYVDTLSADTVILWGIDAMLELVDPFTEYYPEDDMDKLKEMTTGKYAGIGALIRFIKKEDRVLIVEPWEDSPATEAGVKAGDLILSIDGQDMKGKSSQEVSNRLRGEAGTTLDLSVSRYGFDDTLSFRITRRNIVLPSIPYYGMINDSVGYIFFDRFVEDSYRDVRQAIVELKGHGAQSLVLDLRGNPGGPLVEAVEVTNLFVPRGKKIVYTKGKLSSVNTEHFTKREPLDTSIPLVVLVDGSTASSAEIVSGALQDLDRAVVVGQRTFGKGLVQMIRETPYHGSLKITTSRYFIPSGRCIQAYDYRHLNADGSAGVVPDSLTNIFYTANGREVRDGGGILPDLVVQPDSLPSVVYDLTNSDIEIEYVNHYVQAHPEIVPPGEFCLSDQDYENFVDFVANSDFRYTRRTEDLLRLLIKASRFEGCYDDAKSEFDALTLKLDVDVRADLMRPQNKNALRLILENDIVCRYYFRRGAIRQQLRDDKELKVALEILSSPNRYEQLLEHK